jgi:type VII secretion protein EccB
MERRDELSAHTFARKRTLAAFLQPESRVSDEEAPRPVRAMMPGTVMSLVLVVGCIAWGAIAPSAPPGWDKAGEYIIVDKASTTRYVVLYEKDASGDKVRQLHPVLNYTSAKLLLDKGKGEVIEVAGEDIDASDIARGATIGIPYAPDRLPGMEEAETPKEWAVCEKPGAGGETQQAVFVLGGQEKDALQGGNRLTSGEALFVEAVDTGYQYIVDNNGTKLMLGDEETQADPARRADLAKNVLRDPGKPQQVSAQWLSTLREGGVIDFPTLDVAPGTRVTFPGADQLPEEARQVGAVLESTAAGTAYYYVVLADRVVETTGLYANLMMAQVSTQRKPIPVNDGLVPASGGAGEEFPQNRAWPKSAVNQVNRDSEDIGSSSRRVSCSVYTGKMSGEDPQRAAWAGSEYPANVVAGSASAYVSSGSGLLYSEVSGTGAGGGQRYLLTDSGLRYAVKTKASMRLGYENAKAAPVPQNWSQLLPKGPTLDTDSASQEQGL